MRLNLSSISLLGILFLSGPLSSSIARADTVTTFALTGDFGSSTNHLFPPPAAAGSPTGTVTIDTTTGLIESINIFFTGLPGGDSPIGSNQGTGPANFFEAWDNASNSAFGAVSIYLPVSTFVGYMGGPICSTTNPCALGNSTLIYGIQSFTFLDGELSPVPEPAGFVLLGTGLLALAVPIRRSLFGRRATPAQAG